MTFAASAASIEEQANSALRDGTFPDGTKPVEVERKIWRAKGKLKHIESETDFDPSEDLDYLYENAGKTLLRRKSNLPPRDDIILFSAEKHRQAFTKSIQWRDCPLKYRTVGMYLIKQVHYVPSEVTCSVLTLVTTSLLVVSPLGMVPMRRRL
jgi:hypothetical protein